MTGREAGPSKHDDSSIVTVVVDARCTGCGACLATCPEHALTPAPYRPLVDAGRCTGCLACLEVCPVDAISPVHPIEAESYRRMAERVDLSRWPAGARDVVARMVHATADESFAETVRVGEDAVRAAVDALAREAVVVCDSRMVVAGLAAVPRAVCLLDEIADATPGDTRSAAAVRLAAGQWPDGALWVVGNAPTALAALLELHAAGAVRPAGVIGLPVGFVGAAEAKAALWDSALRPVAITNVGERGGSAAAVAAVNALVRLASSAHRPR